MDSSSPFHHIEARPRPAMKRVVLGCAGVLAVCVLVLLVVLAVLASRGGTPEPAALERNPTGEAIPSLGTPGTFSTDGASSASTPPVRSGKQPETIDDPALGSEHPILTIVEFSDFECPFCRDAYPIIRELALTHKDSVRYIYRDFPVDTLHANARRAAEAGACAHKQEKFWAFHDRVFQNQSALAVDDLKRYARASGLDGAQFDACLDRRQFAPEVAEDLRDGVELGVRGTPTWFFNGHKVEGVIPLETFRMVIERFIKK